jgi:uncharacterized membrane protein YgcG
MTVAALMLILVSRAVAGEVLTVADARPPIMVQVSLPELELLTGGDAGAITATVEAVATTLLRVHEEYPDRLLVLDVEGSLWHKSAATRAIGSGELGDATSLSMEEYHDAAARWLVASIDAARAVGSSIPISVAGLPVESPPAGASVDELNARYSAVIDAMSAFMTRRSFILIGQSMSELDAAHSSLPEAFRLRGDRPIVFRTNGNWRVAAIDPALAFRLGDDEQISDPSLINTRQERLVRSGYAPHLASVQPDDDLRDERDDDWRHDGGSGSTSGRSARDFSFTSFASGGGRGGGGGLRRGGGGGGGSSSAQTSGHHHLTGIDRRMLDQQSANAAGNGGQQTKKPNEPKDSDQGSDDPQNSEEPRAFMVGTWHPLDIQAPDWVKPSVLRTNGHKHMFGRYDGDYITYTADVIDEIQSKYEDGEPVVLMLQHWMQKAHTGGSPEGIDKWGMFSHKDDRTSANLPGIWPNAAMDYWHAANDYLFSELKAAGINVAILALDTEVTPRGTGGPYAFEGTHEAIVADPRWSTVPLRGFDGMTAADLWTGHPPGTMVFDEWIRLVGRHSFAHAYNEVFQSTALVHYPDLLISDYRWHDLRRNRTPRPGDRNRLVVRAQMVAHLMDVLELEGEYWLERGVGNVASPALYGRSYDADLDLLDAMIELYGSADRVVPWFTDRVRMGQNMGQNLTVASYEKFIAALVDRGITWFLWHPGGQTIWPSEQQITVNAFKKAFDN